MGSYDSAVMIGFICQLCKELNRNVVHIYSDKGRDLHLAEKLNLTPLSFELQDNLPKTICRACITLLDSYYMVIQQLNRINQVRVHNARRQATEVMSESSENSSVTSDSCDESTTSNNNPELK